MTGENQPCEECAQMERKVLVTGVVAGLLMGAGVAMFVMSKARK